MTRREWIAAVTAALSSSRSLGAQAVGSGADDVTTLTLSELVGRMVRRELAPRDVADAYLVRLDAINPDLKALVTVTPDRARIDAWRAARTLPPPPYNPRDFPAPLLLGAPIAHKDLFETAGIRTTAGSRLYESHIPTRDAFVVSQLSRAGAVLLGKTNTHELGGGVTTINPFFGTTRNPVDRARIAGGSSGGSAAAVVARLCVAATGSDTGGSVRIPAALCGCVGFKPTFGRISTAGLLGSCPTFDHVGFLTRTVADAELIFAATLGRIPPNLPEPPRTFPNLRIGVPRSFFFGRLQPDVARAMEESIERFRAIGATIEDVNAFVDGDTMARVFDPIIVSEIWTTLGAHWRRQPELFSSSFGTVFKTPAPSDAVVATSRRALRDFRTAVDRVFERVQILLTPTVPITAPLIEGPIDGMLILRNTWPFNAAGAPAISIPCGVDAAGLPIGLQLVARRQQDQLLLKVARELERDLRDQERQKQENRRSGAYDSFGLPRK